ncbi:MAG: hypothetical protein ATN34_05300 [Epulopiscium sp. Nele67-Bin002]|nr:MAG: hypothetical protein ATN33_02000 [Epulopiscium sp. Nele67-Bin001]OON92748.1 MAG: hypothetical protein ATN34_05300 [Epulopiscium sp. Nele67-Bin002]
MAKKEGVAINTLISTAGSVGTRLVGMCSMIYISNQIGAEGVGLYQLAMTVYMMAYMVASAGIITSISKLVAEEISRGWFYRAKKIMTIFLTMGFFISLTVTAAVYFNAEALSELIIKDTRIVDGLKVLSLSIPFMTLSACFKGYFYGIKDIAKPASSEVLEQFIKLALLVVLLTLFGTEDLVQACIGMSLSITLGEILSFIYLGFLYLTSRIKGAKVDTSSGERSLLPKILAVLLPITASSYLTAVFVLLENTLIPLGLHGYGMSTAQSISIYGMIKGMVFPLLFFPTALLSACSTVLTPEISRAQSLKYKGRVESLSSRMLHLTLVIAFFVVTIFTIYGEFLGAAVYGNYEVGRLLQILVFTAPFMYVEIVLDGILKGMGEQKKCLNYRVIDSILRISLMYFLIPKMGINGLLVTLILSSMVSASLHFNRLITVTKIDIDFNRWVVQPGIAALAAGLVTKTFLMDRLFSAFGLNIKLVLSIVCAILFYATTLIALQNVTAEELSLKS